MRAVSRPLNSKLAYQFLDMGVDGMGTAKPALIPDVDDEHHVFAHRVKDGECGLWGLLLECVAGSS